MEAAAQHQAGQHRSIATPKDRTGENEPDDNHAPEAVVHAYQEGEEPQAEERHILLGKGEWKQTNQRSENGGSETR